MKRILAMVCLLYIGMQVLDAAGYCMDGDDGTQCATCSTMQNIRASEPAGVLHDPFPSAQHVHAMQDKTTGRLLPSDYFHPPRTLA